MGKLRTCLICDAKYEHCNHCPDTKPNETWRNIYDKEECMKTFDICSAYVNGLMKKSDAKIKLKGFKLPDHLKDKYQKIVDEIMHEPVKNIKPAKKKQEEIVNTDLIEE